MNVRVLGVPERQCKDSNVPFREPYPRTKLILIEKMQ